MKIVAVVPTGGSSAVATRLGVLCDGRIKKHVREFERKTRTEPESPVTVTGPRPLSKSRERPSPSQ